MGVGAKEFLTRTGFSAGWASQTGLNWPIKTTLIRIALFIVPLMNRSNLLKITQVSNMDFIYLAFIAKVVVFK